MERVRRRLRRFVIGACVVGGLGCLAPVALAQDGINRPPGAVDGRGYELVSQADKNGNQVVDGLVPAASGDSVLYAVHGGLDGTTSGIQPLLIADRGSSGWVTRSAMPPRDQMYEDHYADVASTADLREILAVANNALSGNNYVTDERLVMLDGGGQTLLHSFPTPEGGGTVSPLTSDDLRHIYISVTERTDPSHAAGTRNVYDFGVDPPQLVSTMPGTTTAPACGVPLVGSQPGFNPTGVSQHQVSTDGRYVFFGSQGNDCSGPTELYVHDRATGQTALVSGPPVAGGTDLGISEFVSATADGSEAFYVTATTLDAADSTDGNDSDLDVYRYDTTTGANTCVTCVTGNADVADPSTVPTDAAASEDGSHVYFVSEQQLLPGAVAGAENVYVVRGGTLGFVGITIANAGVESTAAGPSGSEISQDGRFLVFASNRPEMDAISGAGNGGRLEYYRYDDVSRAVTCVSCPPGGAATGDVLRGRLDGGRSVRPDLHAMTADGSTVLFVSPDKLVPEDVNGSADIYEWHDGTVRLITDGVTRRIVETAPQILDVSLDGRDVFFQDVARLTWDAQDDATKIYDARIGGGFPAPPPPPVPCASLECHGQPSFPPSLGDAASSHASSSGNVRPTTPAFVVSKIAASQRKRLAHRGTLVLKVRVGRPGRVSVIGQARIGRRIVQVASAAKTAHRAGTLRLTVRLSKAARRRLAASHRLTVVLGVEYSQRPVLRRIVLHLTAPTRHGR